MSSVYRVLCLSHDPALDTGAEWSNPGQAIAAARLPAARDYLDAHASCDLRVGRYSVPLIELCCPGKEGELVHGHGGLPTWVDVKWLRLLALARRSSDRVVVDMAPPEPCWPASVLHRLRIELSLP